MAGCVEHNDDIQISPASSFNPLSSLDILTDIFSKASAPHLCIFFNFKYSAINAAICN